jgi:hypothetical protein
MRIHGVLEKNYLMSSYYLKIAKITQGKNKACWVLPKVRVLHNEKIRLVILSVSEESSRSFGFASG